VPGSWFQHTVAVGVSQAVRSLFTKVAAATRLSDVAQQPRDRPGAGADAAP
jgi:hypothetical protein